MGQNRDSAELPLRRTDPKEVTQIVSNKEKNSHKRPSHKAMQDTIPEPNKINASTPYDFTGKNLTPYGGLLPVVTMLEKLGFQSLVEQTVTSKRIPRAMDLHRFVLSIVLRLYIDFPRLNQLHFVARAHSWLTFSKVIKLSDRDEDYTGRIKQEENLFFQCCCWWAEGFIVCNGSIDQAAVELPSAFNAIDAAKLASLYAEPAALIPQTREL